jgi:MFS family permease
VLFGSLADRIGRRPTMILTILTYSLFSGLTYFAQSAWQVGVLRFIVALGTAGEWAVAATFVAEAFPARSRAQASAVFHASSSIGVWLASLAGLLVGANWRYAFLLGVAPALLVLWVRARSPESSSWSDARKHADADRRSFGSLKELLFVSPWSKRAIFGLLLAVVGLGTYWGITVAGQDLVKAFLIRHGVPESEALAKGKFAFGLLINGGGMLALIGFGSFAQRVGRRRAFACALIGAMIIVPITCYVPQTYGQLLAILPLFGALTFGFHSGFAIYFPELFATHLRGTGTGFCFNGARMVAGLLLVFSGWLKSRPGMDIRHAVCLLSVLYVFGLVALVFLPETKGEAMAEVDPEKRVS